MKSYGFATSRCELLEMLNTHRCRTERSKREFEAKTPGPPKKRHRDKQVCIVISYDEPDEQLDQLGDDWSLDLRDDLVKNNPEQWDIRDALSLGK